MTREDTDDREGLLMTEDSSRDEQGLTIRREVLGAEHVDRSLANASEFARPLQELVTECCWGAVWSRPGLTRRERSLVNLGILTALNRQHELRGGRCSPRATGRSR